MSTNTVGAIYRRKRKGRKMEWLVGGGVSLEQAQTWVRWDYAEAHNLVFFYESQETGLVGIVKPYTAS
jgi:hypothetical protein